MSRSAAFFTSDVGRCVDDVMALVQESSQPEHFLAAVIESLQIEYEQLEIADGEDTGS